MQRRYGVVRTTPYAELHDEASIQRRAFRGLTTWLIGILQLVLRTLRACVITVCFPSIGTFGVFH